MRERGGGGEREGKKKKNLRTSQDVNRIHRFKIWVERVVI